MFISIHIPKTAGTALAYIFDYGSGRRIMYDYRDDYSNATMDDLGWWREHRPFIERQFDFIHGHFFYSKYADLFPEADFVVCLRNPVDRIISQFNHVYFEANPADWQYRTIVEHDMDVVEYAKIDGVHDAQARHLEGRDIKDYEFVFLSETMSRNLSAFQVRYQFARSDPHMRGTASDGKVPTINSRSQKVDVSSAQRAAIQAIATEDDELYRRGAERAEELVRLAGLG